MSYKTVSSKEIIGKVYRDFKPGNASWTYDAIEWIGEAIGFIGYHCGLETKVTCDPIEVCNHRACFPCDMETLIGVSHKGRRLPLGTDLSKGLIRKRGANQWGGDGFNYHCGNPTVANYGNVMKLTHLTQQLDELQALEAETPSQQTEQAIVDVLRQIDLEAAYLVPSSCTELNHCGLDYYSVNPDYIITSFEAGFIDLIYMAFPTDGDGFPNVLDESYYKEAVMWYIIRQMVLGGYKHPEFDFGKANAMWELYRGRAANKQKIPSLDQLSSFTNVWTRWKFDRTLPSHFFSGGEDFRADLIDQQPTY